MAAVAAIAIAGGTASSQAASPPPIVFSADRAPSLSGEIYRVDPNGRRVDLSRSPYQDTNPVVSSDGKHVAFFSDRSAALGVYEVGIDGRGLVQVGASVGRYPNGLTPLAWQPHGGRLAFSSDNGDWILQAGRKSKHMPHAYGINGWSPDGRVLAVKGTRGGRGVVRAVSPLGRTLWTVGNVTELGDGTWSAHDLLAVPTGGIEARRHGLAVYDEAGQRQFNLGLGRLGTLTPMQAIAGTWFAWSPDGSRLAFVSGRAFQVRTATGRVLVRKRVPKDWAFLVWDGNSRVVGFGDCGCRAEGIDIRTGKMSPASNRFAQPTSPNGKLAVLTPPRGAGFAIQVAWTAGGPPRTYAHVPGCSEVGWHADASFLQLVPGNRSLVYGSYCPQPTSDLYSVPPGGGAAHRITSSRADHSAPALSPDGSKIAYSWNQCSHGCRSGSYGIRVLNVDGSGERVLTNPAACRPTFTFPPPAQGDLTPTWSPDGTTILFSRVCGAAAELYAIPANGGDAVHDLGIAGSQPAWGPSRIAYVGAGQSLPDEGVWTVKPDGTDPIHVTGGLLSYSPAWSPDGRLAYLQGTRPYSPASYGNTLVVGSTKTTLPFAAVSSLGWSPAGTRLVVTAQKTKTAPFDVYSIEPDGSNPIKLTQNYGALSVSGR